MLRLFIALDLPDSVIEDLIPLFHGLPDARWSHPNQLHITLKFIGEVSRERAESIQEELESIRIPPFEVSLMGVGSYRKARMDPVLWAGVEEVEGLYILQKTIDRTLSHIQVPVEKRPFHPHITLARMKRFHHERMEHYMNLYSAYHSENFRVQSFQLYSSQLRKEGPLHTVMESYALKEP